MWRKEALQSTPGSKRDSGSTSTGRRDDQHNLCPAASGKHAYLINQNIIGILMKHDNSGAHLCFSAVLDLTHKFDQLFCICNPWFNDFGFSYFQYNMKTTCRDFETGISKSIYTFFTAFCLFESWFCLMVMQLQAGANKDYSWVVVQTIKSANSPVSSVFRPLFTACLFDLYFSWIVCWDQDLLSVLDKMREISSI